LLFVVRQVGQSVNAKHSNGKFYGAFITSVIPDGTYIVYYPEDGDTDEDRVVKHEEIKSPLPSDRQKTFTHWSDYKGKVFYDEGTVEDSDEEPFEPGEFVVQGVIDGTTNFSCARVGTEEKPIEFDIGYVIGRIRKYEEE